jgi:protein SCO1/2
MSVFETSSIPRVGRIVAAACISASALFAIVQGVSDDVTTRRMRPAFRLQTTEGRVVDSGALKGRPYALFFGFASCPEMCATTLTETQALIREVAPAKQPLSVYFVTIDPERDTPQALEEFTSAFGENVVGLTGTEEAITAATKSLRVYSARHDGEDDYSFDHSTLVYLVNSGGEVADMLSAGEPRANALRKIRTLAFGGRL